MSLSPQWLDELRARVTLSSVVGRTTRIQKAGREFRGCCPFHNEKTPSFYVNDEKGFYHCFGCGAHGDVIRWMTDQRGLGFLDAVKELAAEAGMEVPAPDPRMARAAAQKAERAANLHDVMAAAQDWFVAQLAAPDGERARAYLATRGFDGETLRRFGFGYAPEGRQALKEALGSAFPEDLLVEAGLRIRVEEEPGKRREPYDRFRGRLMLPIHDPRGRVIAFGGRILDKDKKDAPKYLNSPDTPLFDKGRTLYNLHRAAPIARQSGRLLVVEGYMDAIALSAAGFGEVVAPLGTAMTETQIEMVWRQVANPVLCFDGDAAGQRAAMRAVVRALPLLRPAHSLRIVRMPPGLDPDDLIRQQGAQAMARVLDGAESLLDTLWTHERDSAPLATPEDKAGLKARLMAHVDTIADQDIKALYRRELLDRFSALAFPRREASAPSPPPFRREGGPRRPFGQPPVPARPLPLTSAHLSRPAGDALRTIAIEAVVTGLVHLPGEILRHAEMLARLAAEDSRIDTLLDLAESGAALETRAIVSIFAERGLTVARREATAEAPYRFLTGDASGEDTEARSELAELICVLAERAELEAAYALATERYGADLTDANRLEQERIRRALDNLKKRELDFKARLGQMATAIRYNRKDRAGPIATDDADRDAASNKMAD